MAKKLQALNAAIFVFLILAAIIFVFIVPCSPFYKEMFEEEEKGAIATQGAKQCTDLAPCDAQVIASLIGCPSLGQGSLKVYVPSVVQQGKLIDLKAKIMDAATATLRSGNFPWAVFYNAPNYMGQAFLVPVDEDLTYYLEDGDGLKSTSALRDFVKDFGFYYGHHFSCVMPEGRKMTLNPVPGGNYPTEPIVIGPGVHPHIIYGKGPLYTVNVSSTRAPSFAI